MWCKYKYFVTITNQIWRIVHTFVCAETNIINNIYHTLEFAAADEREIYTIPTFKFSCNQCAFFFCNSFIRQFSICFIFFSLFHTFVLVFFFCFCFILLKSRLLCLIIVNTYYSTIGLFSYFCIIYLLAHSIKSSWFFNNIFFFVFPWCTEKTYSALWLVLFTILYLTHWLWASRECNDNDGSRKVTMFEKSKSKLNIKNEYLYAVWLIMHNVIW